uniref:Uncharacterized protein n=1 Tax=Arundo donax TaxID=35708 RepID=A0A0A9G9U5_ARUDO
MSQTSTSNNLPTRPTNLVTLISWHNPRGNRIII